MNAILARLRTLLAFVEKHSIPIDLRPESEEVQAMVERYYAGVEHLRSAGVAFLAAEQLWNNLHDPNDP